ncbi:hypothetical protein FACS1894141_0460 [Spirochaetia bacterium]|nr:hypothetical protein FACS1894141_0460 [Spirochaetia bacterium]
MTETTDIELQIKVDTEKAKQGIIDLEKSIEETTRTADAQEQKLTNSFGNFIPGSIKKALGSFNEFKKVVDMKAQSAGATTFGTAFKTIVTSGIKSAATAMKALWAATGPIGLAIGAIVAAVILLTKGISGAVKAQKEYNENTQAGLNAMDALKRTVDGVSSSQEKATQKTAEGEKAAIAQKMVWEAIGNWFSDTFGPVIDWITDKFKVVQNLVGFIANKLGLVTDEAVELRLEFSKTVEQAKEIASAEQQYADQMAAINLDSKKGAQEKLSAAQSYLDALAAQYVQVVKNVGAESQMAKQIKAAIDAQSKLRDEFAKQADAEAKAANDAAKAKTDIEERKEIEASIAKQIQANNIGREAELKLAKARNASEEELKAINDQFLQQQQQIYEGGQKQVEQYLAKWNATREEYKLGYQLLDLYTEQSTSQEKIVSYTKEQQALINEITDALAEQAIEAEKDTAARIQMQNELIDVQRARAREEMENEKAFQALTKESQADVLAKFDAVTEGMKREIKDLTDIENLEKEIADAEAKYREVEAQAQLDLNAGVLTQKEYEEQILTAAKEHNSIVQGLAGKYAGVEGATDKLAGSLKNVEDRAKKVYTAFENSTAAVGALNQVTGAVGDLAGQLADNKAKAQTEVIKKELEASIKLADETLKTESKRIDDALKADKKRIDDTLKDEKKSINAFYEETHAKMDAERQRVLVEAGFIEGTSKEALEAAMQKALATMDADIIYAEQRRQEKLAIEKKYDDAEKLAAEQKNKELETAQQKHENDMFAAQAQAEADKLAAQEAADAAKEAAQKKAANAAADIEYKQYMSDWIMQLVMLPGQIAAAIMQGYAQAGPFAGSAGAIIAASVGAIQLAALMAAKPKKPTPFAMGGVFEGGIVEKPTRFKFAQGGMLQDGIMGEAGAEAILPLERTPGGALGVNAAGGSQQINVVSPQNLGEYLLQLINDGNLGNIRAIRISN